MMLSTQSTKVLHGQKEVSVAAQNLRNPSRKGRMNTRSMLHRSSRKDPSSAVVRFVNLAHGMQLTVLVTSASKQPTIIWHPIDKLDDAKLSCGGENGRVDIGPDGRLSLLENDSSWSIVLEQPGSRIKFSVAMKHADGVRDRLLALVKAGKAEGCIRNIGQDIYTTPAKNGGSRAKKPYQKRPNLPTALAAWRGRM
jgi:hypothetical protein